MGGNDHKFGYLDVTVTYLSDNHSINLARLLMNLACFGPGDSIIPYGVSANQVF